MDVVCGELPDTADMSGGEGVPKRERTEILPFWKPMPHRVRAAIDVKDRQTTYWATVPVARGDGMVGGGAGCGAEVLAKNYFGFVVQACCSKHTGLTPPQPTALCLVL